MSISDLFTLIAVFLAIFTFISETSRKYIIMKFSINSLIIIITLFLLINFLLVFDWLSDKNSFLKYFTKEDYLPANIWAYIVSLLLLIYVTFKIFFGFFPKSKMNQLLQEYFILILKGEFALLINLIEKYHKQHIIEFLNRINCISSKMNDELFKISNIFDNDINDTDISSNIKKIKEETENRNQLHKQLYDEQINNTKLKYARSIFYNILMNEAFINFTALNYPYFYTPIIEKLSSKETLSSDFVNQFLKILTKNKNQYFFNEIRSTQNLGDNETLLIPNDALILKALFDDITIAKINGAWMGIAEEAILEMEHESKKDYSELRENGSQRNDDILWNYRMKNAIHYFDIMVRKAINENCNDSMWLFYYYHFVKSILNNIEEPVDYNNPELSTSRNFYLLENIFMNINNWIIVVIGSKNIQLNNRIFYLLGGCILLTVETNKLSFRDQEDLISMIIESLITFDFYDESDEDLVNIVIEDAFKAIREPMTGYSLYYYDKLSHYLQVLESFYHNLDQLDNALNPIHKKRYKLFKFEVLDKLQKKLEKKE